MSCDSSKKPWNIRFIIILEVSFHKLPLLQLLLVGVFQSQIIRYFRICSELDSFVDRLRNIILKFIQLGFEKRLLKSRFKCICSTHDFRHKFTEIDIIRLYASAVTV